MNKTLSIKHIFSFLVVVLILCVHSGVEATDTTPPVIGAVADVAGCTSIDFTDNVALNLRASTVVVRDGKTGEEITPKFTRTVTGDGTTAGSITLCPICPLQGYFINDICVYDLAGNETCGTRAVSLRGDFSVFCRSVDPSFGKPGQTLDVTTKGDYECFDESSKVLFSCQSITVNSAYAKSATEVVANITIAEDAPLANCDVWVDISGYAFLIPCSEAFEILAPSCESISPMSMTAGNIADVNIKLLNTPDLTTIKNLNVNFGCTGITVNSVTATSATEVNANISVACDAQPCTGDVTVTGDGLGTLGLTCADAFTVDQLPPCTLQVSPIGCKAFPLLPRLRILTLTGTNSNFNPESQLKIEDIRIIKVFETTGDKKQVLVLIPPKYRINSGFKKITVTTDNEELCNEVCTGEIEIYY